MIAIDPGKQGCAVAYAAYQNQLTGVWWDRRLVYEQLPLTGPAVVWEKPQADGRGVPVQDLLDVCHAGADLARWYAGPLGEVQAVTPREWKGGVPKPIHHGRLADVLTDAEFDVLGGVIPVCNAIGLARDRGTDDHWRKDGKLYYRAKELPTVNGLKITHDILDAVALLMWALGRLPGPK
jgi:hypothetical protein